MSATTLAERLRRIAKHQTLSLTHYGRKSGKPFQVTIWFLVDGEQILLVTANVNRNWVKNVRKTPHVILRVGTETFEGEARFLDYGAGRDRVLDKVRRKYWMFLPFMALGRLLTALGLMRDNVGAFQVTLSP